MFFPFGRVCGWRGFVSVWFYRKTLEGQMERVNLVPSSSSSSAALTTYSLFLSPSLLYVCSLTWCIVELGTILAVIMGYAGQHRLRAKILLKHLKMLSNIFSRFSKHFSHGWNIRVCRIWGIYLSKWANIFVTVGKYMCPGGQIVEPNNWQKKSFAVSGGSVGAKLGKEGLRLGQLIPFLPLICPTRLCIRPTRKIEDWIS